MHRNLWHWGRNMTRYFMRKNRIILGLMALLLWAVPSLHLLAAPRAQTVDEEVVVVIDAGHGGENLGAKDYGRLEKELTLVTAQAMYDALIQYDGVKVYMTRTADTDLSLEQRAQFAKDVQADFLFSVHYNASDSHRQFGSEVLVSTQAPYNAYGFQFGTVCLKNLTSLGLYNRGIKARAGNEGDYYGLLRESSKRGIPSVIIEHCYLDFDSDKAYADSDEDLKKFGQLDAKSVAEYFGLKSSALGVDYSKTEYVEVDASKPVPVTISNQLGPEECEVSLWNNNPSTGDISIAVHGFDTNAAILYYDYSLDGGNSFTPLYQWPNANPLTNTNDEDFVISFQLPQGSAAQFILRNYNMFDYSTASNVLDLNTRVLATEFQQGKAVTPIAPEVSTTTEVADSYDYTDNYGINEGVWSEEESVETPTEDDQTTQSHTGSKSQASIWLPVLLLAAISLIIVLLLALVVRLFVLEHRKEE